jgi:hypothetical protein
MAVAISSAVFAEPPKDEKKFRNHLEDEDYDVEKSDDNLTATHDDDYLNIILKAYKGGVLVQTYIATNEMRPWHVIEMVNTLNTNATVARFYIDSDQDTMIESWYPGKYNKDQFDDFLDAWHSDTRGQLPLIRDFLNK